MITVIMEHVHRRGPGGHSHAPANFERAFAIGIALNAGFVVLEVIFGLASHSVALLADGGHKLSESRGLPDEPDRHRDGA